MKEVSIDDRILIAKLKDVNIYDNIIDDLITEMKYQESTGYERYKTPYYHKEAYVLQRIKKKYQNTNQYQRIEPILSDLIHYFMLIDKRKIIIHRQKKKCCCIIL